MFASLLIANRGEIACRIVRTARRMGLRPVAVTTDADRTWPHGREADAAVRIGEGPAADSYLSIPRIVAAALESGAEAVHPGYGFLSENAAFAEACAAAGLIFVGPPPAAMRAMGSKAQAKAIMIRAGVPVVPGYAGERQEPDFLKQKAYEIGYPVLVKAVSGGGGRGMRRVDRALDFEAGLAAAKREALSGFGDDRVLVERYVERPRHIEVQVFADQHGNVLHLAERDCSVQRRHQKVVEEAPAPGLPEAMRRAMGDAAVQAAAAVGYQGAGTVEFIVDNSPAAAGNFFFLEMNTRLQVEHPVTEAVTGLDLVEWQLRVAAGEALPLRQDEVRVDGHAIEARIYAEDPQAGFRPSTGRIRVARFPSGDGIRVDAGVETGSVVGPHYDAMLAKIIAQGADRPQALERLAAALRDVRLAGPNHNLAFLSAIVTHPAFRAGGVDTGFVDRELEQLTARAPQPGAAAAVVLDWVERESLRFAAGAGGIWAGRGAFELGGLRRRASLEVDIDGVAATADLVWSGGRTGVVSIDAAGSRAEPATAGEIFWDGREAIFLDRAGQVRIKIPDPLARRSAGGAQSGEVAAPMPGRIAAVAVAPGDRVQAGDLLFTLEAMKMEHAVLAPVAGKVSAVRFAPGDQVEQGAAAISIEADATPVE